MIVYKDKRYIKRSEYPDSDWLGDADYVVPDDSELSEKIIGLYPYFCFVFDDEGKLIDVTATEKPPEPEPEPSLEDRITELEAYNANLEEKITELETYNATLTECILEMSEYVYS